MHWDWLKVLPYMYEVMGGVLIFYSSAVTETQLPKPERRKHWLLFGGLAVVYILLGIGLRHAEVRRGESDRNQAELDRQALRDSRASMDARMDGILLSSQGMYTQIASLSSDLSNWRVSLTRALKQNDPQKVADLEKQAQIAQARADNLSHELLALTMTPQVARQLRSWEGQLKQAQQDQDARWWNARIRFSEQHPRDSDGLDRLDKEAEADLKDINNYYRDKLREIISNADFVRKEMLQRIPPQQQSAEDKKQEQQFALAKNSSDGLSTEDAARYIEELARRVPPAK